MNAARGWRMQYTLGLSVFYVLLYFASYFLGRSLVGGVASVPIDRIKFHSGISIGMMVSVLPFFLIGWMLSASPFKMDIHVIAAQLTILSVVLEKIIPLTLAAAVLRSDPLLGSGAFGLLSEEFPYFSFSYFYFIVSTLLSYLSVYAGFYGRSAVAKCKPTC
ncbi:hypothetical protein LJK87_29280 [Paenibacillus sp. P25]|nr:hypothetical protein LJK87_29280 [Paenibacillus sp. P25]